MDDVDTEDVTSTGWIKLGRLFQAKGQRDWMVSHTATPSVRNLGHGGFRVYFGTRDGLGRPRVGYVETNVRERPLKVGRISELPVLDVGPCGHFDDNGVYPGTVIPIPGGLRMYYSGRSNGERPLYYMSIGSALSVNDGESFDREFDYPVLTRGPGDPWMVTTPCVMAQAGLWLMWYTSGIDWPGGWGSTVSRYHVRHARSFDGISWDRVPEVSISLEPGELNIASPAVLEKDPGFEMWFSVSDGRRYQLGHAVSRDGVAWTRRELDPGLSAPSGDWDQGGMAYPHVFRDGTDEYMVYSGKDNGLTGIGIALRR